MYKKRRQTAEADPDRKISIGGRAILSVKSQRQLKCSPTKVLLYHSRSASEKQKFHLPDGVMNVIVFVEVVPSVDAVVVSGQSPILSQIPLGSTSFSMSCMI